MQVALGIPLDASRCTLQLTLPGGAVGVHPTHVLEPVEEARAGDAEGGARPLHAEAALGSATNWKRFAGASPRHTHVARTTAYPTTAASSPGGDTTTTEDVERTSQARPGVRGCVADQIIPSVAEM
jgi:hypothetical protein